jgi:Zn-dependent M28 family amino/carboxypeptidase
MKRIAFLLALSIPLGAQTISPHAIAAHIRFLAGDLLEGRETGTRGYDIGAEYVAAQFTAIGLQTSQQPIAFRSAKLIDDQSSFTVDGQPLAIRKEVIPRPNFLEATSEVTAPVVFAGFGIVAPELTHDDYAGIDARGKIVLILSGAPPNFPTDQRAYYSSGHLKDRTASEHGAVGILTLNTITDEKRTPFEKRAQQSGIPPMLYLDGGRPADAIEGMRASALVSHAAAERLFAGAPTTVDTVLADAEKSVAHAFALATNLTARTVSEFHEVKSANVIGFLRGSDPKLRDEFVVVSAHLDHLGNHPPANGGDAIYNGAYDNASGIACLIEIARGLAAGPRPKRSVAFVAMTGEEKGLQGSKYFVHHPPVSPVVADVNMDMFLMLYPVADLIALGGEHTTLGELATRAAHDAGFEMSPDPFSEEVRFIRSDQFSFVEAGIPAIHLKPGNKSRDPKIDGTTITRDWLRRVYHSPADDMNQPFDFASGARYAETNLRLVRAIADATERPAWRKGDFFAPK